MDILERSYQYGKSPLTTESLSRPLQTYFFGTPISKSLSLILVPVVFESMSVKWEFTAVDTTLTEDFVERRDQEDFLGSSITMPNKMSYKSLCDELTEEASTIGAVNTTFVRLDPANGRRTHIGANLDCVGIRDTLVQKVDGVLGHARDRPALVIGAGGAARSAVYALWQWMNPSEIYICNRLKSEAEEVISSFEVRIPGIKIRYVDNVSSAEHLATPYVVVGTIPDYPATETGEIECLKVYNHFLAREDKGVVLEMCYIPHFLTKLFVAARDQGWNAISGMEIVARIVAAQAALWLEREPSEAGLQKILKIVYKKTSGVTNV